MTQKTRVLVVDDDFDNADMTVMMLEFSGYEARAAFDSEQAVRRVAGWVPDCVLMDLGMPVDGFSVAQKIRNQSGCRDIAIVALSGYGGEAIMKKARLEGFSGFLVKPAHFSEVIGAVIAVQQGQLVFG